MTWDVKRMGGLKTKIYSDFNVTKETRIRECGSITRSEMEGLIMSIERGKLPMSTVLKLIQPVIVSSSC